MENFTILEEYFPNFKRIEYRGKEILYLDLTDATPQESIDSVKKTFKTVRTYPKDSILFFANYTRVKYNKETIAEAQDFVKRDKPYVKKSAIIGVGGLKRIVLSKALTFSGRTNIKVFEKEKDALDWLVDY